MKTRLDHGAYLSVEFLALRQLPTPSAVCVYVDLVLY